MSLPKLPEKTVSITLNITYNPDELDSPEQWAWNEFLAMHGVQSITIAKEKTHAVPPVLTTAPAATAPAASFSARHLHALLYPHSLDTPLSLVPGDCPVYRIRSLPWDLGVLLSNLDPQREFFHFIFYKHLSRVEVWERHSWDESISKRRALAALPDNDDPLRQLQERYHSVVCRVRDLIMTLTLVNLPTAMAAAEYFITNPAGDQLFQAMLPPEDLRLALLSVRNELTKQAIANKAATDTEALSTNSSNNDSQPT